MSGANRKTQAFVKGLIICLAGSLIICAKAKVQAAPPLRITKNGVIYYYFSHRDYIKKAKQSATSNKVDGIRSQLARKVPVRALQPVIEEASSHHNLPPALIKAVIQVESNFNAAATSPKGAQGLMQLMPETAATLGVANPYDIQENIWAGTRYLFMLLQKFNNSLPHALAAYNAGPQRVAEYQSVPPIMETQEFVRDVCIHFLKYQNKKF